MIFHIDDEEDPRIALFRGVRERDLVGKQNAIMVEGEVLLKVLLSPASRTRIIELLVSARQYERLHQTLVGVIETIPIYVADQRVLDQIVGFHLHRGIMALAERPATVGVSDLAQTDRPVVGAIGIGNHDNMGGLFRNAAALGAAGVVLDSTCCDPFYRKAIRVSAGAALRVPYAMCCSAQMMLQELKAGGRRLVALSPSGGRDLHDIEPTASVALLLGTEGPGLPDDVLRACETVRIPMAGDFDSLNVATASALALEHFTRHLRA